MGAADAPMAYRLAMSVIESHVDASSAEFRENLAQMDALEADLRARLAEARAGGGEAAHKRQSEQGKLLARDRIERLLDPGTPFLEIGALAANGLYDGAAPSAGIVTGIGRVRGREVMVVANDATVKGGTYFPLTVKKHLRAQEIAEENRLPCVYLVDSGGAFLPLQDRGLSRPRALRAHLLQRGADERARASRRSAWCWARARPAGRTCRP